MKLRNLWLPALAIIFYCSPLLANVGLPMVYLGLPFLAFLFVPICLIEIFVLTRRTQVKWTRIAIPVIAGNVVSTLLGYPLSWLIMLGLEWITTGGMAYGTVTLWGKIIAVTVQSAWLVPYESEMYWMVPIAGMVGLIPAYFISVWSEGWIARKLSKDSKTFSSRNMYVANLFSYGFLFLILLIMLLFKFLRPD